MTPDRDETLLREALQTGLHPAETDLWPAVAQALPAGQKRHDRRVRALRLAICLGAPLLLAAGALLGQVKFTDLRTNPRPSFAPENNTGYAIQYDQTAYQLPDKLMDSLQAHYNGEWDADGMPPMISSFSGRNTPSACGPGGRGYDSWAELSEATGLPLLQNPVLDNGTPANGVYLLPNLQEELRLPDDWYERTIEEHNAFYDAYYEELWRMAGQFPAGFTVSWAGTSGTADAPDYLFPRRVDKLDSGYTVETMAQVALASPDRPAGTTTTEHRTYWDKKANLVWEAEEYTTPSGIVALLPVCTSNGKSFPWLNSYAFFEHNGILYTLTATPCESHAETQDSGEATRAVLKEVLDSFEPAA